MSYKCKVCGKRTATANDMATHMVSTSLLHEKHVEWIESHDVSYIKLIGVKGGTFGRGNYLPLMEVIEKECKVAN